MLFLLNNSIRFTRTALFLVGFVVLSACSKEPPIDDTQLDGPILFDPSLYDSASYKVSVRLSNPSPADLAKPVIIVGHGYSASTFEWDEFASFIGDSNILVSRILLDGHGRTYADFKAATWQDWKQAYIREYEALVSLGFKNISFAGSSAGGALLISLLESNYFKGKTSPKNLFLVDAIVVSSIKIQSLAGIVGPMLGYVETSLNEGEKPYWYSYRPQETVRELNKLIKEVRQGLERGIKLPEGTALHCLHSNNDPTANAVSAKLLFKGIEPSIQVKLFDSDIHVFTRLAARDGVTEKHRQNQQEAFVYIKDRLLE
jgi:carboxylesterase